MIDMNESRDEFLHRVVQDETSCRVSRRVLNEFFRYHVMYDTSVNHSGSIVYRTCSLNRNYNMIIIESYTTGVDFMSFDHIICRN